MSTENRELDQIAARYARFARDEAQGSSEVYETLARAVAASIDVLKFLATLPAEKRQPNLFFAAVRHLFGVPDERQLIDIVRQRHGQMRALILSRTTQTNEPARCAVLLPVLARLPQPLALLEVGASAGLCLLPDRYGYDYGVASLAPPASTAGPPPVFECRVNDAAPIPHALPTVVWRAGIDLNPIDVNVAADTAWLETLVWPGQIKRLERLRAALAIARSAPPRIVRGNLLTDLPALMAEAPEPATLVVFHTAVLAYVTAKADRERFAQRMRRSSAVWISNEIANVFPDIAESAPAAPQRGMFLLSINGRAVAWTAPHGDSISWFGS